MTRLMIFLLTAMCLAGHAETTLKLAEVARFDASAIGYAAAASPNYQAFRVELNRGEAARPLFEELLERGTPAAKLYSALGLYHLDRARGSLALEKLKGDKAPVSGMSGCMMEEATVGQMAAELLKDNGSATRAYLPARPK